MPKKTSSAVDSDNPWPGLASFTEETKSFFHGRDQEVTELFRRVQRKLLTILFGQSGHGKSSLLRAGLVPKLRPEGYCPIYVRLDHTPGSMSLSEQIKEAVFRVTAAAGTWTKPGASVAGESLWEFLHHRDDLLKDDEGRTLVPLIIFDQFEEIFTLAQTDATGRARADAFVAELADLVENRPPVALEERLEENEADADRFDFTRSDYRILITLREDYLPHLEALKKRMPSITQNRLRLSRLSGKQACESVLKTGGNLVTPEVAEAIVKFVSGADEIAHAEVEPSLLSLVCRELNEARKGQGAGGKGQAQITADLLAGSREAILGEYYERTLREFPVAIREFIEDELLTTSGFRESVGEERVAKAIAAAGAPADTLAALVNQRLLRIEERLDVRRVELTHDVLCAVVKSSRDTRLQRLALRKARRLRYAVAALAVGLAALVTASVVVAFRSKAASLAAAQRSSRSDFTYGSQYLEGGKTAEGLAYLARAAESDPLDYAVGPRLISALTSRPFTVPVGLTYPHADSTDIIGFSKDGTRVVTTSDDNTLSFWNVATGQRVIDPVKLDGPIYRTAISDSGNLVAVGTTAGTANVWDVATGRKVIGPLQIGTYPVLQFSPDARWLATGNKTSGRTRTEARLWDTATGELKATMPMQWGGRISTLSFNADGTRLVVTDYSRLWHVWAVPSGELLTPMPPGTEFRDVAGQANYAQFSPDGRLLVVTDLTGAQLWDWAAQRKVGQRMSLDARSDYAAFSPDGTWLVTGNNGVRKTAIWNAANGVLLRTFDFGASQSSHYKLSRDGTRLLFVSNLDGSVTVVSTQTGRPLIEPLRTTFFLSARFSPDEQEIWTSDRSGVMRRWRAAAAAALPLEINVSETFPGAHRVAGSDSLILGFSNRMEARNIETGAAIGEPWIYPTRYRDMVVSPDGAFAAVLTSVGAVELWDFREAKKIERHPLGPVEQRSLADSAANLLKFSGDSSRLALMSRYNPRVSVFDTDTGRQIGEIHSQEVTPNGTRSAFDARSQRLALGDNAGEVAIFEIATGKQLGATIHEGNQINEVAFSPDGTRLAGTSNSRQIHLWDAATGRDTRPPLKLGDAGRVNLRFSSDGRTVTFRSEADRTLHFWDTRTGQERTMPMPSDGTLAVDESVFFNPENARVAIDAADEGLLRIFGAGTGQILVEPIRAAGPITGTHRFSPDGRFITTQLAGRSTIDIWPVPTRVTDSPVPGWLPRLAVAVAGGRINETGEFRAAATDPRELTALKAELAALPENGPFVKWGRWFLDDPATRTINPESPLTSAQALAMADKDPLGRLKANELRLRQQENWTDAEVAQRDLLARLRDSEGPLSDTISTQLVNLARSLNGQGRFAEAEVLVQEGMQMRTALGTAGEGPWIAIYLALGESLAGQGKTAEAETTLLQAVETYKAVGYVPNVVRLAATALANLYEVSNQPEKAALWKIRGAGNIDYGK